MPTLAAAVQYYGRDGSDSALLHAMVVLKPRHYRYLYQGSPRRVVYGCTYMKGNLMKRFLSSPLAVSVMVLALVVLLVGLYAGYQMYMARPDVQREMAMRDIERYMKDHPPSLPKDWPFGGGRSPSVTPDVEWGFRKQK